MHFAKSYFLVIAFIIIFLLLAGYFYYWHRRLLALQATYTPSTKKRVFKFSWFTFFITWELLIVISLLLGLSQPQWIKEVLQLKKPVHKHWIILDASKSMRTLHGRKTRLEIAVDLITTLLQNLEGFHEFGFVIVGEQPWLITTFTIDRNALQVMIEQLTQWSIPDDGTALGDALALALSQTPDEITPLFWVFSDGGLNRGEWDLHSIAQLLHKRNIRCNTILIGDSLVFHPQKRQWQPTDFAPQLMEMLASKTQGLFFTPETWDWHKISQQIAHYPTTFTLLPPQRYGKDLSFYFFLASTLLLTLYLGVLLLGVRNPFWF